MTAIPTLISASGQPTLYDLHRYHTTHPFEQIAIAIEVEGPKFVFSHVYFGHPPFVFGPNGEKRAGHAVYFWDDDSQLTEGQDDMRDEYIEGHRSQVSFLNGFLLDAVGEIIDKSEHLPIIIIHGDHGPGSRYNTESPELTDVREWYSIFYAALFPGEGAEKIYPSLSPINGMRLVLN